MARRGISDLWGSSRAMQWPAFAWAIVSSSVMQRKTSLSQWLQCRIVGTVVTDRSSQSFEHWKSKFTGQFRIVCFVFMSIPDSCQVAGESR